MRPPSPLRSRPDPTGYTSGMPPMALGRAYVRASALPKARWGHFSLLGDRNTSRGECDRGGGSGTERGRVRCVFRAAVLGMARHAAGSLFRRDSSPTPHTLYTTMSSRQPAALKLTPTSNIGRREKTHLPRPRSVPPAHPHTHSENCPRLPGIEECSHFLTTYVALQVRDRAFLFLDDGAHQVADGEH